MSSFKLDVAEFERLQNAMKSFQGDTEKAINEVLHKDASTLIQDAVKLLMPISNRTWTGKKAPAKTAKSLTDEKGNLYITVKTTKNYQYLYFPDDGSNTKNHAGNQQFFMRGAESQENEIIERCIAKLVNSFEDVVN